MDERTVPRDLLGREIKVGDICVYPVRKGSKMWMNRVNIHRITWDVRGNARLSGLKGDGYPVSVTSLTRVVIVGRDNIIPFAE